MIGGIGNTNLASQLFSRLDTSNKGYLEKSDLASAFSKIASKRSDSSSVDDVFSALDTNSDGKVTESEFSSTLAKLQDQLQSNFQQSQSMHGGGHGGHGGPQGAGGGMPPPPANDTGFSKDELQSQLDQIGSTDSQRASLISNIVNNFSAADTDGDGKVSFSEAMAYDQSNQVSASSATSGSGNTGSSSSESGSNSSSASDAQVMRKIMELMHAYGGGQQGNQTNGLSSLLSLSV